MANSAISGLTADATPTSDDLVITTNDAAGTPASKKVTLANAITKAHGLSDGVAIIASNVLTSDTTPDLGTPSACVLTNATGYPGDASLVTVGTIASGAWQGTAIDGAYIDIEGTEIKSTGEAGGTKFLREDGDGTCSWQTVAAGGNTLDQAYDQGGAGAGKAITVDSGAIALTASDEAFNIVSSATTQTAMKITADSLTSGNGLWIYSNSGASAAGNLLFLENDGAGAKPVLRIQQDAIDSAIVIDANAQNNTANIIDINVPANSLTTGNVIDISVPTYQLTSGELLKLDHTTDTGSEVQKTGNLASITSTRGYTDATARTDDFDLLNLTRSDTNSGAGTLTSSGSVLRIEHIAVQSSGTLTDTVKGIEVVMGAGGEGTGIDLTTSATTGIAMKITADSLTTGDGLWVYSNSADASGRSLVFIEQDNAAADATRALEIQQDGNTNGLYIKGVGNSTGTGATSLAYIYGYTTTGATMYVQDNAGLTTGSLTHLYTNSADVSARNLLFIENDNVAAVGAIPLGIQQDALVTTNFKKYISLDGLTLWKSDTTDPDGTLTGAIGDICFNAVSNQPYYNTDGATAWSSLAGGGGNTLDQAYDQGGAGAGKAITVDSGAIALSGGADLLTLDSTVTTDYAMKISSATLTDGNLLWLYNNSAGLGNDGMLYIHNDGGTNTTLKILNSSAGLAIDSTSSVTTTTAHYFRSNVLTTGKTFEIVCDSGSLTSGVALESSHIKSASNLPNKTGSLNNFISTRTNTRTSTTQADDFDLVSMVRTDVMNGAGGTTTAAGSVLYVENVATQTAGTLTDTVKGIEVVMSANGTGAGIDITSNAATGKSINIVSAVTTESVIEVVMDSATTFGGTGSGGVHFYSNASSTSARNILFVEQDNAAASNANCIKAQIDGNGSGLLVTGAHATGVTTSDHAAISAFTSTTTGDILGIHGNSLTTGSLAHFLAEGADASTRSLVKITNDHASATGVTPLEIVQDAPTDTNFKKIANYAGLTVYISDGTTAEGNLTGVEGDICLNGGTGNGQMAYCDAAGTNWTDM